MDMINTKTCLNCGEDLKQLPNKRSKVFCNGTCRSNYWQKSKRLEEQGKSAEEIVKILSKAAKDAPTKKKEATEKATTTTAKVMTDVQKRIEEAKQQFLKNK